MLAELSTEEGLQALVDIISNRQIDILVNNAGFGVNSLYQECDLKTMEQMAKVNVLVPMKLIRIVLPGTEGLHLDLMNTGVKVQAVCPGFTRTDFHEKMGMNKFRQKNKGLMKWMSPEEVVDISLKDLEKNKVICIPGIHTKLLIRLLSLFPKNSYYKFVYDFSRKNFGKQPS